MSGIIHIQQTDSTNNYLKELLLSNRLEEGTIVCADFQISGKGQRGNSWESEHGKNLLFSTVLYPNTIKANEQFIISQIISLSVAKTLNNYTNNITIKWPNDIYWENKKICGILIENSLEGDSIKDSVCGIGININQTEFRSDAPNPVSLKQITNIDYNKDSLLKEFDKRLEFYYGKLKEGDFTYITQEYKSLLFCRKGYHIYNDGTSDFYAKIKDVDQNGTLLLETKNGQERRFAFKEVRYINI